MLIRKVTIMKSNIMTHVKRISALAFVQFCVLAMQAQTFAYSTSGTTGLGGNEWPWTKFFNSLMQELTGPLPAVLGIMGIVGAAIALFSGNGGDGTRKFILLIFVISIALAAPTMMSMLSIGATGAGFTI